MVINFSSFLLLVIGKKTIYKSIYLTLLFFCLSHLFSHTHCIAMNSVVHSAWWWKIYSSINLSIYQKQHCSSKKSITSKMYHKMWRVKTHFQNILNKNHVKSGKWRKKIIFFIFIILLLFMRHIKLRKESRFSLKIFYWKISIVKNLFKNHTHCKLEKMESNRWVVLIAF